MRGSFSAEALRDIGRVYAFLASKDPSAAARAADRIRGALPQIAQFPRAGRSIEGLPETLRDWTVPFGAHGYILRYRIDPGEVVVLRVRHSLEAGF